MNDPRTTERRNPSRRGAIPLARSTTLYAAALALIKRQDAELAHLRAQLAERADTEEATI